MLGMLLANTAQSYLPYRSIPALLALLRQKERGGLLDGELGVERPFYTVDWQNNVTLVALP